MNRAFIPNVTARALRPPLLGLILLASTFAGRAHAQAGEETPAERIERVREVLDKWVEARGTISKEQRDWALRREMLEERIAILERDIESKRNEIGAAQASVAAADKKRDELKAQNDRLKQSADGLAGIIAKLEDGTRKLVRRLPQFAQERIKLFSQRLPPEGGETKLLLSDRYQSVIAILNDMNKFHREITLTPEIRELPDGRSAEVATVYVGLGQGYFASGDGKFAGIGSAGDGEWKWRAADAQVGEIARMIAILKNDEVADFVRLPIRID